MQATRLSLMLVAIASLWGCAASQPDQQLAEAAPQHQKCVQVTGSSVCRKEGSGQIANVQSLSGDALRKSPDALSGPAPSKVGN